MSFRKYFKVIPFMLAILMVFSSFAFIDSGTSVSYKGISPGVLYSVPLVMTGAVPIIAPLPNPTPPRKQPVGKNKQNVPAQATMPLEELIRC